jgi:hypothetical protein
VTSLFSLGTEATVTIPMGASVGLPLIVRNRTPRPWSPGFGPCLIGSEELSDAEHQ